MRRHRARVLAGALGLVCAVGLADCGDDATDGRGCKPSVTASLTTLYARQQSLVVYDGTCFTPSSDVVIHNITNWASPCRGIIVVPAMSAPVGADGTFQLQLPSTLLAFTLFVGDADMIFQDASGELASVTLHFVDGGTDDTYIAPGSPGVPLTPIAPAEHGTGTVVTATDGAADGTGSFRSDVALTLAGAAPDHTYGVFMKAAGLCASFGTDTADAETRGFGTLTTDASGAGTAFFHSHGLARGNSTYYAPIVSLTDDLNLPGVGNVAYEATLTVVNQMLPPNTAP